MKRTLSIKNLLAIVAVIAGGLGSMRVASELLVQCGATLLMLVLLASLTGAIVRRSAACTGFAVFAMGYVVIVGFFFRENHSQDEDLTGKAIEAIADTFHNANLPAPTPPKVNEKYLAEYMKAISYADYPLSAGGAHNRSPDPDAIDASMLTSEEVELMKKYKEALTDRAVRSALVEKQHDSAVVLGFIWMSLLFGTVGSVVGRLLEKQPASKSAIATT